MNGTRRLMTRAARGSAGDRAAWLATLLLAVAAIPPHAAAADPEPHAEPARMIVVALPELPDPLVEPGSTPRGYGNLPGYSGSQRGRAEAAALAREYGLREVSAWTIAPLHLRCMLYEIAAGEDRDGLLARLAHDRRVHLAQPLREYTTFSTGPTRRAGRAATATATAAESYNDPYVGLQHGFRAIDAAAAQRWSAGHGVRIALVDTGVDASHPDLAGRIETQADFVAAAAGASQPADRHGTEVAGVIAAVANNRLGIVGIAPDARLLAYRACWPTGDDSGVARCNTYTIALALGAAIASGAPIINLSLGGPPDALLAELAAYAVRSGTIVVAAVPPDGRLDGFPVNVPGVIAVASADRPTPSGKVLAAPGTDILTAVPGGHYDYASGNSLAAAHVSGAIALLLELRPRLDADALLALLHRTRSGQRATINACRAGAELRGLGDRCNPVSSSALAGRNGPRQPPAE